MTLAWDRFEQLSGAADRNFEVFVRALVRRRWGAFGQLRDRLNQPGIEFHLQLHSPSGDLGDPPCWWGWQCKYYSLTASNGFRADQRREIAPAVGKAREDVPGLTDFVLCLPRLPRAADLKWYDEELQEQAPDGLRLHRWGPEDLEAYVEAGATVLRSSFFGELVLTDDALADCHAQSVAPIKRRWVPEIHVVTHVERRLAQALLREEGAETLASHAGVLTRLAEDILAGRDLVGDEYKVRVEQLANETQGLADTISGLVDAFAARRPDAAAELLAQLAPPATGMADVAATCRRLKSLPSRAATAAATLVADVRRALAAVADVRGMSAYPVLAIIGDAGSGKSHLGAQITAPTGERPAGVFTRGVQLARNATLDNLAARLPRLSVGSFDDLLEACDAAGARAGVRLPIVIDGLNESQRPADWPDLLAQLVPTLGRYPNVRVILTYRGALTEVMRREGLGEILLDLDEVEVLVAARRYFTHYKIDPGEARVPLSLFSELLYLRIYCEATNPERQHWVGAEALPQSLVDVFERFVDQVCTRVSDRPNHPSLPPGFVQGKLDAFALRLWDEDVRELPWDDAKLLVDRSAEEWDESLLRALEEEGILATDDLPGLSGRTIAPLFDRLGGYLIASKLVRQSAPAEVVDQLVTPDFWARLTGPGRHPYAEDIRTTLVGLLPRHNLGPLWRLAPTEARDTTLLATLDLESTHFDDTTLDALVDVIPRARASFRAGHPFDALWRLRNVVGHKLNARFLDRVLRSMSVTERDLTWTEWVRMRSEPLTRSVEEHRQRWEADDRRSDADALAGLAIAWLQTSTTLPLRDAATRALQRLGYGGPDLLFDVAAKLLDVDDLYVVERVVGAAYGAATTRQMPEPGGPFESALRGWLTVLADAYLEPEARHPTSHALLRGYVSGCFELAAKLHPTSLPDGVDPTALVFGAPAVPEALEEGDQRREEAERTLHMDFSNYTIGGLFDGRSNYEMDHVDYVRGLARVAGRVWELGWREADFADIDREIADDRWRRREDSESTERYGKKYGWIAYYELAGHLSDAGQARDERWARPRDGVWPDIDPSFPSEGQRLGLTIPAWASEGPEDVQAWMADADILVPDELLVCDEVNGVSGPWVLVDGYLRHEDAVRARTVFAFLHGVLVPVDRHDELVEVLHTSDYLGNRLVDHVPEAHSVFGGEIPWSRRWEEAAIEGGESVYEARVGDWETGTPVEVLAHAYDFSADRSTTVEASGHRVPARRITGQFDLREFPRSLHMVELDGTAASLAMQAPEGHEGRLLYVRRDLLESFADGRRLVQVAWGEREHRFDKYWDPPAWLRGIHQEHAHLWRRVETVF